MGLDFYHARKVEEMTVKQPLATLDEKEGFESSSNSNISSPPRSAASSLRSVSMRRSFFGRSSSDAGLSKRKLSADSASSPIDDQNGQPPSRPSTSLSARRRIDPFESIRNSVLGSNKTNRERGNSDSSISILSRPSSRTSQVSQISPEYVFPVPPSSKQQPIYEEDDYHQHLRSQNISPPFNFQHVAHTSKPQLPALQTVAEKDLSEQVYSPPSDHAVKPHIEVRAEEKRGGQQRKGSTRGSFSDRPLKRRPSDLDRMPRFTPTTLETIDSPNETTFNESTDTRIEPDEAVRSAKPHISNYPKAKRFSSALIYSVDPPRYEPISPLSPLSNILDGYLWTEDDPQSPTDLTGQSLDNEASNGSAGAEPATDTNEVSRGDDLIAHLSRKPLPPLPILKPIENTSTKSFESASTGLGSMVSSNTPVEVPSSSKSKNSPRSYRANDKSPTSSSTRDTRQSRSFSDVGWEDDVDFSYEQEAEATCEFNWDLLSGPPKPPPKTDEEQKIFHAHSPALTSDSGNSSQRQSRSDAPAEQRQSQLHGRGSSVGHRGFLAARKSSADLTALKSSHIRPVAVKQSPNATEVDILSPVFSIIDAQDDEVSKAPFTPGALHFPGFDGTGMNRLSDPESYRDSSSLKHRKSNSYGSYESVARSAVPNSVKDAKDGNRWSLASFASVPDLVRRRSKNRSNLSTNMISAPLETLPQSPGHEKDAEEAEQSFLDPRATPAEPDRTSYVMRRPQTSGDRALLQAAGRAVQRYRPGTPSRGPARFQTPDHFEGRRVQTSATGSEWI